MNVWGDMVPGNEKREIDRWGYMKYGDIKDSGERVEFPSGMVRDTDENKPRYDLVDEAMLTRWAWHMAGGAKKYGDDNWRRACSRDEMKRFKASAFRHFVQWFRGETDEDHAAAVLFNIAAAEYVKGKLDSEWVRWTTDSTDTAA